MFEDAWDMVVHSDMMETFRCEILIHEQFLSDLANCSQSCIKLISVQDANHVYQWKQFQNEHFQTLRAVSFNLWGAPTAVMTVLFSFVLQEPPKPQFFMGIPPLTFTMFMPRHLQRLLREKQNYHEKNGFNHSGPSLKKSSISGACHMLPHVTGKMEQPNIWWKFESLGWNHAETWNLEPS